MSAKDSILKKVDWKKFNQLRIQTLVDGVHWIDCFHARWMTAYWNESWCGQVDNLIWILHTSTFFIHVYIKNTSVVYLQLVFLPEVYSNLPATESTHYLAVQVNGLSVQQDQVTLINILINIQHWSPTTINLCPLCTGEHNYYLPLYLLLFGTELFHTMCVGQDWLSKCAT